MFCNKIQFSHNCQSCEGIRYKLQSQSTMLYRCFYTCTCIYIQYTGNNLYRRQYEQKQNSSICIHVSVQYTSNCPPWICTTHMYTHKLFISILYAHCTVLVQYRCTIVRTCTLHKRGTIRHLDIQVFLDTRTSAKFGGIFEIWAMTGKRACRYFAEICARIYIPSFRENYSSPKRSFSMIENESF